MSDHIEIPLPGGSVSYPPNPKNERMKHWVNIITVGTTLAISIAAIAKPADGGTSEQIYKEMVRQLEIQHKENIRLHEDILKLRVYLNEYLRSSTVVGTHADGIRTPTSSNAPVVLIPVDRAAIRVYPGSNASPVLVLPAGAPPPLPDVHEEPRNLLITEFRALQNQADAERALRNK